MDLSLEYKTHRLLFTSVGRYTKVKNYVLGTVYQDMVSAILLEKDKALNFVYNERILLNNFIKSLLDLHNNEENFYPNTFTYFNDEYEYYVFCIVNDIEFKEQEWFNIAFVDSDIFTAYAYCKNASIKLLSMVYPEYCQKLANILEQLYRRAQQDVAKYKCPPDEYKYFLEENEIDCLYHFSSSKNIESIKKRGICSIKTLKDDGVYVDFVSTSTSQYIDKKKGLEDYIHLGYEAKHPMLMNALAKGILSSHKVYRINPIVIFLKETKYTMCNAIKRGVIISDEFNFFLNIPFKSFHKKNYFKLTENEKELFQSEVLVYKNISNDLII